MKRFFAIAVLTLAAACQTTVAPTTTQSVVASVPVAQQGQIGTLLNAQRDGRGQSALVENARLSRAARAHAADMVANDYFSHDGRNGLSFVDRARAAGYNCVAAENIAFGQRTPADVITAWMNSSGHRRNMLLPDATEYGIGRVDDMWVLLLGRGC